jgi:hypothetical protein
MHKKFIERRKNSRFKVDEGAFAVPKPRTAVMGKIIDISNGGLTFGYFDSQGRTKESFELTIAMISQGFKLDRLPCKTVSDFELPSDFIEDSVKKRRCCVKFGQMTGSQKERLEYFIQKYTRGLIRNNRNSEGQNFGTTN